VRSVDPLDRALELMQVHQVRRIPVVDEDNCIVGIISQADVAREAGEHETAELVEEVSKPAADG
jgi:CBS-domain-containing membrane protein